MMKKVLLQSIVLGSVLFSTTACMSGQPGYGSAISSQLAMVQNYRSNAENIELQGAQTMLYELRGTEAGYAQISQAIEPPPSTLNLVSSTTN